MIKNIYKITSNQILKLIVLSLVFVNICSAQSSIGFEHLSTEDGLSQSDVNAIYQDKKGFMWFGTHDGLNRYDGYKFTVFKPDPTNNESINSNLIWVITGDKKDNLWIGTTGNGLNYYDRTTDKFTHFVNDSKNPNSLINNHINSVFVDSKDRLWVGVAEGVEMVDRSNELKKDIFQHIEFSENKIFESTVSNNVYTFFEDKENQLWVGGNKGLAKLSRNESGDLYLKYVNDIEGLPNTSIRSINEDIFGRLIIGSVAGLFTLVKQNNVLKAYRIGRGTHNIIRTIDNQIWGGTTNGLLEYETDTLSRKTVLKTTFTNDPKNPENSLTKNNVKSVYVDRTGIVWIGADAGGISKLDPNQKQFQHITKTLEAQSLSNNSVKSIFEDSNGTLWVGVQEGGLNYITKNKKDSLYNNFEHILGNSSPVVIVEIEEKGKKKLLVGSAQNAGVYIIDITNPDRRNLNVQLNTDVSKSVFAILEDKSKNLWLGTYSGGVYRWLRSENSSEYKKDFLFYNSNDSTGISSNIIRDILEDSKGNIWFATGNGLCMLPASETDKKNPKFTIYKNKIGDNSSLSHNYILTIFESSNGDIWVGTFGGGLNKLVPSENGENGTFQVYSRKNGLPNDVIKGIIEDEKGSLWVSTNGGLSKFNPTTEIFKNFDINDGLQSNEFGELACYKRQNGEVLFGGVNGLNIFKPKNIKENIINAETVLTEFSIFNKPVAIGEEINSRIILNKSINEVGNIELKYIENSFSFEFAALHYAASRKNTYAYKLEGFDQDWVYTNSTNRYATYTNLEPGIYTLKVKASNNDGAWDETPIQLKINVTPPFWRTKGANAFYVIIFFLAMMAFRRFTIIRSTRKHQLELEHIEKDKHEEINKLKLEFFTNISHEFRTPLTLIKGPLEYLQNKGDNISSEKVHEQYNLMHKNIDYLLRLINQLLDFRKMDKGKMNLKVGKSDIVDFIKVIGEPFQFLSSKKDVHFKIEASNKSILTWFDPDAVEKIMNNLLSNAFKFTPKDGNVTVDISEGRDFKPTNNLKTKTDKANYIVIRVRDTGSGIPKHRVKFIFERFYVDRDVRKVNSEGTGIGLAFTKKLVELHQGSIDVVSDDKDGTEFVIWLPKYKESYENINGISFSNEEESKTFINEVNAGVHAVGVFDEIVDNSISKSRSKLPVLLVVDDNSDIRTFIKLGLEDKYDIYEAENGERGFELAKRVIPNIILTDVLMPVMDGIEFCDKLKTTQETSHIPVVMLTAKISQEWEREGLKTGADAYIRKPFDMELLELKLLNILKHREELRKRFNRDITLQPEEITVTSADEQFLNKAIEIVEKHMMNSEFSVELLVKEMCLSRSNLYLKIKELTGLSSSEFIRNIRLKRAVQLLEKSDLSVKEIMYMTGFNTASYFSKCFKKQFGVIPSKYIRQNKENKEVLIEKTEDNNKL